MLLTTTTKVASPYLHEYKADRIFDSEAVLGYRPRKGEAVFYAEHHTLDMKKWISPREEVLTALSSLYDVIISESDGSRGLPLKIHTSRDPVIHPLTAATVAVMGVWGIGERAFFSVFGEERDCVVDKDYLEEYISSPEGLLKGARGETAIVFNGAEKCSDEIISMLSSLSFPSDAVVFAASEEQDRIVKRIQRGGR